jgi:HK97 family phage prohead protease
MSRNKRFVLSDGDAVNSNGYRIDISGVDLTRFNFNPVMLYEHDPKNVVGRWTDIRKEDHGLTAIPEFDTEDTEVLVIAGKVERGFLNGASVGIIVKEAQEIDGVPVVTKSELFEASIVSVPADARAVRLYNENLESLTVDKLKLGIKRQKRDKSDFEGFYGQICAGLGWIRKRILTAF